MKCSRQTTPPLPLPAPSHRHVRETRPVRFPLPSTALGRAVRPAARSGRGNETTRGQTGAAPAMAPECNADRIPACRENEA